MQFFKRKGGSPLASSAAREKCSVYRHRSSVNLEILESRDLLSAIAGVSLQFGNLAITATKAGGNTAQVSIDSSNHNVKVTLNGQSQEYSANSVTSVTYKGGSAGGDTFANNTNLVELAWGYGGHNSFTGGTYYNYVFLYGKSNTYNVQAGSFSDLWENGGNGDSIDNPSRATVQLYA
jgi:hypothetical protein